MLTVTANRATAILYRLLAPHDPNGTVLIPANICAEVPLAVMSSGLTVEFVDIDPVTLELDEAAVLTRLRQQPQPIAIIYVRTFGRVTSRSSTFAAIKSLCPQLLLIDDRCLCIPRGAAEEPDANVDAVVFSTGRGKALDLGSGGFAYLQDNCAYLAEGVTIDRFNPAAALDMTHELAQCKVRQKALPPESINRLTVPAPSWLDMRPNPISERDYLSRVTEDTPRVLTEKAERHGIYRDYIPEQCFLPDGFHDWRTQIKTREVPTLLQQIFQAGLFCSMHYYPAPRRLGDTGFPVSSELHEQTLNLFNDRHLSVAQTKQLAKMVRKHVEENGIP